jgi:cell division protein FtsB
MKKVLYHPLFVALITLLVIFFIFNLRSKLQRLTLSQENLRTIQKEVNQQEKSVEELKELSEKSQTPLTVEKLTRSELLMQKEDEVVIKLPEIKTEKENLSHSKPETPIQKWFKILNLNHIF